jgi:enoyl-CoA hydratase/carnithine racemase
MAWEITVERDVAVVRMRSNAVNKMNPSFFDDLQRAFDRLDAEHPDRPVVLTGDGKTFSAGLDFDATFPVFQRGDLSEIRAWFASFRGAIQRAFYFPRPLVAAVNGHALAGGLILALCADFRFAAAGEFRCGLNEVPVGIPMPSVYTEIVRLKVGTAATTESILTGAVYSQADGLRLGFYDRLVAPEALLETAIDRARVIPADCMAAYVHSKKMLLWPTMRHLETDALVLDETTIAVVSSPALVAARTAALSRLKAR